MTLHVAASIFPQQCVDGELMQMPGLTQIDILQPSFASLVIGSARIERLATDCRWNEGPVWFGDWQSLIWSDIPNDRMLRLDAVSNRVSTFRKPSNFANGNTRDLQGRLITCEHLGRRVTRTEHDGAVRVLADKFAGKRLNSPNDVVVKSDGSIWFTDPPFGISGDYEGQRAVSELPSNVYRVDPLDHGLSIVAEAVLGPNGLAFSPDERLLYLVESRSEPRRMLAFDVSANGLGLTGRRTLFSCDDNGALDGFRVDERGNLWCGWGTGVGLDGVAVFAGDGRRIGHIHLPERCANLAFGGLKKNRLFMAATTSLYALYVNTRGL